METGTKTPEENFERFIKPSKRIQLRNGIEITPFLGGVLLTLDAKSELLQRFVSDQDFLDMIEAKF